METSGNFYQSEKNIFSLCRKIPEMTDGSGQNRKHQDITAQLCHSFKTIHNDKIQELRAEAYIPAQMFLVVQKEGSEFFSIECKAEKTHADHDLIETESPQENQYVTFPSRQICPT